MGGLAHLLCANHFPHLLTSLDPTNLEVEDEDNQRQYSRLNEQWSTAFKGCSLTALKEMLHIYENDWRANPGAYYAKTFVMFQSSGTGKSRLAHEAGKSYLEFPFVFRKSGDTGYPPGDIAVAKYLEESLVHSDIRAAAFISAVFSTGMQMQSVFWCYN